MKAPPTITLLPGALMPGAWLQATDLQAHLPAIGAALASGRLRLAEAALPPLPGPDKAMTAEGASGSAMNGPAASPPPWAHLRWLASLPAFPSASLPIGTLAAAARLLPAADLANGPTPAGQLPEARATHHGWLMRPVNFRLTTDSMLMDADLRAEVDEAIATRMLAAIRPLLADEGHDISPLSPTRWLLTARPGVAGWQLQTTPLEATVGLHIDDHLPQGPDARRFRRLLNEIQMSWYQDSLREDTDLPANAVWLEGPLDAPTLAAVEALVASGLRQHELLWLPRLHRDLGSWLDRLAVLDQLYLAAGTDAFACLLCGEHQARWLYTPEAATCLEAWQPAPGQGSGGLHHPTGQGTAGPAGRATPGPAQPSARSGDTATRPPGRTQPPASLLRLMAELLSPRAAWHALRERLATARAGRPAHPAADSGQPPRSPEARLLYTLLSESREPA